MPSKMPSNPVVEWLDSMKSTVKLHTGRLSAIVKLLDETIIADYAKLRIRVDTLEAQTTMLVDYINRCEGDDTWQTNNTKNS